MKRTRTFVMALSVLMVFSGLALSADFQIQEYLFTWTAYKAANLQMVIEKAPGGTAVVLVTPGGSLGRVSTTPEEAKALGELLKQTKTYYDKQMAKKEINANELVDVGALKVSFSSNRGKKFLVRVMSTKTVTAAANMSKEDALAVAGALCQAPEMVAFVEKRIKP